MKTLLTILAVLVLAVSANAIEPKKTHIYLGTGVGVPTGTLGDGWNLGFHVQGGIGLSVAPQMEIVPTVAYHTFGLDKHGFDVSGGSLHSFMFGGDFKYSFTAPQQKTVPFFIAGFGLASVGISDLTGFGESVSFEGETKAYINFGVGIDIESSARSSITIGARYVSVMTSGEAATWIPFTVGVKF